MVIVLFSAPNDCKQSSNTYALSPKGFIDAVRN